MQDQTSSRSKGKIALLVGGIVLGLVALVVAGAGGTAVWADTTQRDSHGYVSTSAHRFSAPGRAITTESVDLDTGIPGWVLGKVRIEAHSGNRPVFVGIGRTRDVQAYLAGVDRSVVTDVGLDPFRVTYERQVGSRAPEPPGSQAFWATSAQGSGTQSLTWKTDSGSWSVVVMNADGSPGVDAGISAGASFPYALWVGIGVTVLGALMLLGAALMIRSGLRRPPRPPAVAADPAPAV
jgi:hypothetical protein